MFFKIFNFKLNRGHIRKSAFTKIEITIINISIFSLFGLMEFRLQVIKFPEQLNVSSSETLDKGIDISISNSFDKTPGFPFQ